MPLLAGKKQGDDKEMMQELVTAAEMKAADSKTSTRFGVDSLVLMERAALSAKEVMEREFPEAGRVLFFCGVGNNGGDGLALARLLFLEKKKVQVILVGALEKCSPSCQKQLQSAEAYGIPVATGEEAISEPFLSQQIGMTDVIVDALLGVGVNRPIGEPLATVISAINERAEHTCCVSLDLPTGIHTDTGKVLGTAVRADLTVTFAFQKLGLVRYPGCEYAGTVVLGDAGITRESLEDSRHVTYTREGLAQSLPKRKENGNKGTFGKVLVIAGSHDMAGAALLSARGAYGVGAGMVKLVTCASSRVIVQSSLPEAMLLTYGEEDGTFSEKLQESIRWADSVVLGPGLSTGERAEQLIRETLKSPNLREKPLVLDADALNLLAEKEELRELLKACDNPVILTPHLGELARLTGKTIGALKADPEGETENFREELGKAVLVSKDARTYVFPALQSRDAHVFVNTLGNDGMATAGSGDVLAGILGGLCALFHKENSDPFSIACLGVAIHAAAGDLAAEKTGKASMRAGMIADALSGVMSGSQSYESMIE